MQNPRKSVVFRRARKEMMAIEEANGTMYCRLCFGSVDYTLKTPDPYSPEADHTYPLILGGAPYSLDNIQLAHMHCNRRKGKRTMEEWWEYIGRKAPGKVTKENAREDIEYENNSGDFAWGE